MPALSEHFPLKVAFSSGQFHLWDLAGHVASTADIIQLGSWIEFETHGYGTLREYLFPGTYAAKLAALGASARPDSHSHLGRTRFKSKAKLEAASGLELLSKLGLDPHAS